MAAQVLVLNCGSSSVKYRLLAGETAITGGVVEGIGEPAGPDHEDALRRVLGDLGLDRNQLTAVGHRVVHGGHDFTEPARIDDEVVAAIRALVPLAPLPFASALRAAKAALDPAGILNPGVLVDQ